MKLLTLLASLLAFTVTARAATFTVTTAADEFDTPSGASVSLREALRDAAAAAGADTIDFAPALSGQTISLGSTIVIDSDVTVDATSLPAGVTIDDGAAITYRLFLVNTGLTVEMRALTLANGGGTGLGDAGAIRNQGTLTLTRCTIAGCRSINDAGALLNTASGTLTLMQCTLSGNQATNAGGAIRSNGTLSLIHCTVSGNTGGQGGGIHNSGPFSLNRSIVSGNTAPGADKDILNTSASAVLTKTGSNLVQALVHSGGGSETGSGFLNPAAPLLGPLASNGGPTQTRALLTGSPAINTGFGSAVTTDQRGFLITNTPDLGAYEVGGGLTVTTTADSGVGSLRSALDNAASIPGADTVTFANALSGQTITLASEIVIADASAVTVDATALAAGVTVDGGAGTNRLLSISAGADVTLLRLTLTGGNGAGATATGAGGAIYNAGTLSLGRCTLAGNNPTGVGGAIRNIATLSLTDCTLSSNTTPGEGGAVVNTGTLTALRCTFSSNASSGRGGAVAHDAGTASFTSCTFSGNAKNGGIHGGGALSHESSATSMTLTHCTLTGNSSAGSDGGGGIRNRGPGLTLAWCLIAGNTVSAGTGPDVNSTVAFTLSGANLIQTALAGGGTPTGPAPLTTAPTLGPLAGNGGLTKTHALLAGSAGIDAATGSAATEDQRGILIPDTPDLGAFEFLSALIVTTTADSGPGSLRAAVANAAILPGADTITFAPALSGQTVTLSSEIVVTDTSGVTVDATALAADVTLDGGEGTNRLFSVSGGAVTLVGLTLTGGNGNGSGGGGAIVNNGMLTLMHCTLSGNSAFYGGAIDNGGALTLTHCTLSGNSATHEGGAIHSAGGVLALTHCTLSGNSADEGGAIYKFSGALPLTHCTLSGNTADRGGAIVNRNDSVTLTHCTLSDNSASSLGGAIYNQRALTLTHSIVAGNTAAGGSDLYNHNTGGGIPTYTRTGTSIVQSVQNNGSVTEGGSGTTINADPLLAPLGNYGGPTQTRALLPGSPARNEAIFSSITTDQRGFPKVGTEWDIGAYEAGTFSNYNAWIYETLPASATVPQHAAGVDFDGDGVTNQNEWTARTDPGSAASYHRITQSTFSSGTFSVTFPTVLGRSYQLQSSPDLANPWTNAGSPTSGTGGNVTLPVIVVGPPRYFFRVRVGDP